VIAARPVFVSIRRHPPRISSQTETGYCRQSIPAGGPTFAKRSKRIPANIMGRRWAKE
jgi:hypothetical protein